MKSQNITIEEFETLITQSLFKTENERKNIVECPDFKELLNELEEIKKLNLDTSKIVG